MSLAPGPNGAPWNWAAPRCNICRGARWNQPPNEVLKFQGVLVWGEETDINNHYKAKKNYPVSLFIDSLRETSIWNAEKRFSKVS